MAGGNGGRGAPRSELVDPEARATIQLLSTSYRALLELLIARGAIRTEDHALLMRRRDEILEALAQGREIPPPDFPRIIVP